MTYDTINDDEATPLKIQGGYSVEDGTIAAPCSTKKRASSSIVRVLMIGTAVAVGVLLVMAGPSQMTTMNKSSNVDGMVVASVYDPNHAVASSSSTSLVGSGTALGGSSAYCKKNTGYNCGAVFPPDGDTCDQKGCCCHNGNGSGYKLNTCDNAKGYAYRGCKSCLGSDSCFKTSNIKVGTSSCHGSISCKDVSDSTIDNDSCHGLNSCKSVQRSTIHDGSCHGDYSCQAMENATIGKGSCTMFSSCAGMQNTNIGNGSCNGGSGDGNGKSCKYVVNVKIGNNSCNGKRVCYECKHNVPDNACNQGITDDMDSDGFCTYCM